jgi:BACON domain-containing protein/all-beta uncharacterized protein
MFVMSRISVVGLLIVSMAFVTGACRHSPTAPSCTFTLSAAPVAFGADGGPGSLSITTQGSCAWTVEFAADWVSLGGSRSGTGSAAVGFTVAGNPAGVDRSATINVADQALTIRQSARGCEFGVSPVSDSMPAEGGGGIVTVDATPGCQWTAVSSVDWLRIVAGAAGTGAGVVEYAVSRHDGDARDGTLTIAGHVVTIHQSGVDCTFGVSPSSQTVEAAGGSGAFNVVTAPSCGWTARSDASWARVTEPQRGEGKGPGRVVFTVDRHDSASPRTAALFVGAAVFGITQLGSSALCEYSVAPVSFKYHWHGTDSNQSEFRIDTASSCPWTVTVDVPWLTTFSPPNGTGSASIKFGVGAYTSEPTRQAPILVRWPAATAGQNVWIAQEGCRYALSARTREFGVEGGRTYVTVFAGAVSVDCAIGCPWTATTNVSWIHITTPMPSAGDNEMFFNVDPSTTGADRTGVITAAGLSLTITQRGR